MSEAGADRKAHMRRWIAAFNDRDAAGEADARAPGYVCHAPGVPPMDGSGWAAFTAGFVEGFPDLRITVEEALEEGDLAAARVTFRGTHTGSLQGLPPTGRAVEFSAIEINRFGTDGRVAEHWVQLDQLGMLRQLGLMVIPGPRLLLRALRQRLAGARPRPPRRRR
jgi:predicted ester cyclase